MKRRVRVCRTRYARQASTRPQAAVQPRSKASSNESSNEALSLPATRHSRGVTRGVSTPPIASPCRRVDGRLRASPSLSVAPAITPLDAPSTSMRLSAAASPARRGRDDRACRDHSLRRRELNSFSCRNQVLSSEPLAREDDVGSVRIVLHVQRMGEGLCVSR
jgi:hypothetical protein